MDGFTIRFLQELGYLQHVSPYWVLSDNVIITYMGHRIVQVLITDTGALLLSLGGKPYFNIESVDTLISADHMQVHLVNTSSSKGG
jgi:hypothetical protein